MGKLEYENPQEISGLNSATYLWSSDYFFSTDCWNTLIYSIQMFWENTFNHIKSRPYFAKNTSWRQVLYSWRCKTICYLHVWSRWKRNQRNCTRLLWTDVWNKSNLREVSVQHISAQEDSSSNQLLFPFQNIFEFLVFAFYLWFLLDTRKLLGF